MPAETRACDLLFDVGDAPINAVRFEEARGAFLQRPPKLGVAVISLRDVPLRGDAVVFELGEGRMPTLTASTCYDREGRALDAGVLASADAGVTSCE